MDEAKIKSLTLELAEGLKSPEDLNQISSIFKKVMIKAALNTELSEHLSYEKHAPRKSTNARNGFSEKTVTSPDGQLTLEIHRDRDGSFEPQLIKSIKHVSPVWMTKSCHCMPRA